MVEKNQQVLSTLSEAYIYLDTYEADSWHELEKSESQQWIKCSVYEAASNSGEVIFLWGIEESRILLEKATMQIICDRDSSGLIWLQNTKTWNKTKDNDLLDTISTSAIISASSNDAFTTSKSNVNISTINNDDKNNGIAIHIDDKDNKNDSNITKTNDENNIDQKGDSDDDDDENDNDNKSYVDDDGVKHSISK